MTTFSASVSLDHLGAVELVMQKRRCQGLVNFVGMRQHKVGELVEAFDRDAVLLQKSEHCCSVR